MLLLFNGLKFIDYCNDYFYCKDCSLSNKLGGTSGNIFPLTWPSIDNTSACLNDAFKAS